MRRDEELEARHERLAQLRLGEGAIALERQRLSTAQATDLRLNALGCAGRRYHRAEQQRCGLDGEFH